MLASSQTTKGFTLLELLIVMLLMSLSVSLVGPSLLNQIEKSRINSEIGVFQKQISLLQQRAYLSKSPLWLKLEGKRVLVFNGRSELISNTTMSTNTRKSDSSSSVFYEFEWLFFAPVKLEINQHGVITPQQVKASVNQKVYSIDLPKMF